MGEKAWSKDGTSTTVSQEHHLCILIHGLWGSPHHLDYLVKALRAFHTDPNFHILVATRNAGSFTYDGIELGAERVTLEIEDTLEQYEKDGTPITKLSVVGYSLGGLVARYVIGLLHSRGWFEKVEPVNFTTFATPHLGVRTPVLGYHHTLWNLLGSRTLSMSGRQLFTIDSFRNTGRPLLSLLADPSSIFIRAISRFKVRSLYANIVNDRTAPYYTTSISRVDPFAKGVSNLRLNYVPAYSDTLLSAVAPILLPDHATDIPHKAPSILQRFGQTTSTILRRLPTTLAFIVFIPLGVVVYLIASIIQSFRSSQRIRLHEAGKAGVGIGKYRIPLMIEDVQCAMEEVLEDMSSPPASAHLNSHAQESRDYSTEQNHHRSSSSASTTDMESGNKDSIDIKGDPSEYPELALSPEQFAMIDALHAEDVKFIKHAVHIQHDHHSHAAIIVRRGEKRGKGEGREVVRYWLEKEFVR